jgi:hypothetical protein
MERLSLFSYLIYRFGSGLVAITVLGSVGFYLATDTAKKDMQTVALLHDTKAALQLAEREGLSYLASGKSPELDAYNVQILKIGANFKQLSENFRGQEDLQKPFVEIQTRSTKYFLSFNEKIQQKQNKPTKSLAFEPPKEESKALSDSLDKMAADVVENSSGSAVPFWRLWGGLILAAFFLRRHQLLSKKAFEDLNKNVSDLKMQSIILDGMLNSISEALIVVDEQGRFTRYNSAAERVIGKNLKTISSEQDAEAFGFFDVETQVPITLGHLPFARALRGEQMEDKEYFVRNAEHPQGLYISISSRYLSGLNGPIHGALVVFRDISRRKATEQEWLRARESALETARKKSDFLAAMSHEIRTPMNGVMGMATLLADTELNAEQSDYVGTIKRSAEALLRLINDILDHSKIEAGMVEFQQKAFDLQGLCGDVLELFHRTVKEKNVELSMNFKGRQEWNFMGDPGRIRQILVNLVGNAVKFTDVGHVELSVEQVVVGKRRVGLKFSVKDTGAGFDQDESTFLFQKYFQTKSGVKYGGTGLGLSICHQLVDLMGGEMGLQSKAGSGSTFWFQISLAEASADQIVAPKEHTFAAIFSGHVLLAEDQVINQRVAVTYLQKLGLKVDVANNGLIAVEKATTQAYDLIFMDCQMPVMTGYEATKRLRENETGVRTPIVALTAEGTSGERKTCLTAGMDDFLTKPLELEKLSEVLHRWLKTGPQVLDLSALEKLKTYIVNNKSLTDALIEDFLKTAPALTEEMFKGLEIQDLAAVTQAAHALKSCSATLGATGLAELCQKIEDAEELKAAQDLLKNLKDHVSTSSQELKKHWTQTAA